MMVDWELLHEPFKKKMGLNTGKSQGLDGTFADYCKDCRNSKFISMDWRGKWIDLSQSALLNYPRPCTCIKLKQMQSVGKMDQDFCTSTLCVNAQIQTNKKERIYYSLDNK